MKRMYTAEVTATGGRSGQIKSSDGILDMPVRLPEGLGGKGGATNPEQLFAAGYAACFQSALMLVAGKQKIRLDENSTVTAQVGLDQFEDGRFGLAVQLDVKVDGVDKAKAEELVAQAHEVCPYSVGTRGNIDVKLNVLD
ncbi:organic hydroperoxide resistance protein [Rufibacter immobilis]|uniref:Organic hydroperoxide resistance protein n=1 Tax=Rufibacter immobilis TaxID=1348778 RepID=A0A3M9MRS8_9BACT|nr:organic hydroperoxide resistance protein [Rufibacter immobilis]RNI28244.1 organic hydroperoxide resistance protein [Rufibacter immobilis]